MKILGKNNTLEHLLLVEEKTSEKKVYLVQSLYQIVIVLMLFNQMVVKNQMLSPLTMKVLKSEITTILRQIMNQRKLTKHSSQMINKTKITIF